MGTRALTIPPMELPDGINPRVTVSISLVDAENRRIQGLTDPDGQPIIDTYIADLHDAPIVVDLWPQPELEPILNFGSESDATLSYYLCRIEHPDTRYLHEFRTQIASGGDLTWAEFVRGAGTPIGGAIPDWLAHLSDGGIHVPPGGGAGDVLGKQTGDDGDTVWIQPGGIGLPPQVTGPEKTDGTETALRSFSPLDVADMSGIHGGGGGVSDHGALTGLADDDHLHYHTDARGDARYTPIAHAAAAAPHTGHLIDVLAGAGIAVDDTNPQYPIVSNMAPDEKRVNVTGTDAAPGYLANKIQSGDGSVIISVIDPGANEMLDLQATGAGGGEANTGQNVGTGAGVFRDKTGVALNFRALASTATVVPSENGNVVEFAVPNGVFKPDFSENSAFNRNFGGPGAANTVARSDHDHAGIYDPAGSAAAVQSNLDTHTGTVTGNPHAVTKAEVGLGSVDNTSDLAKPISTATQSALDAKADQTALTTHIADGTNPHAVDKAQVGLGNCDNTSDLAKPISTATQAALNAKLGAVIDDTDPYVGGDLKVGGTNNYVISYTDVLGVEQGSTGYINAAYHGVYLAYSPSGVFNEADGAVLCDAGETTFFGASVIVDGLRHTHEIGQQVYISPDGILYGVDPPAPGWSNSDVDAGSYDLGTGTSQGPWVQMTGLVATVQQDVADGARIDVQAQVTAVNKTGNRSGTIELGFGIDAAPPSAPGASYTIAPGQSGSLPPMSTFSTTHGGLLTGQTISVWGRRASGDHSQFGVDLDGSSDNHELDIYVAGGGGGGGDPTNLGTIYTSTTFTITSSTGSNALVAEAVAGGDAGALSGARAAKVDASITALADDSSPQLAGALDGNGQEIAGYVNGYNDQSGISYTLVASDSGKVVALDNAAAITLNLPDTLPKGFVCTLLQAGAGAIQPSTQGGATFLNRQSHTETAGQGAMATLVVRANAGNAAAYVFAGDTA